MSTNHGNIIQISINFSFGQDVGEMQERKANTNLIYIHYCQCCGKVQHDDTLCMHGIWCIEVDEIINF